MPVKNASISPLGNSERKKGTMNAMYIKKAMDAEIIATNLGVGVFTER